MNLMYPQFSSEWEVFPLSDRSFIFNGFSGKQLVSKNTPEYLQLLCHAMNGMHTIEEVVSNVLESYPGYSPEKVTSTIMSLYDKGLVKESLRHKCMTLGLNEQMFSRFQYELEALENSPLQNGKGVQAFLRIRDAHVTVIGAGGNGSSAAVVLAAAGVGRLTLIDGDVIEESNLIRQIFYNEEGATKRIKKVVALKSYIESLSRYTKVEAVPEYIESAEDLDHLIPKSTNFILLTADMPRYHINDWTYKFSIREKVPCLGSFQNMLGPVYCPIKSNGNPFESLAKMMRGRIGNECFDAILKGLDAKRHQNYPSILPGPVTFGSLQAGEIMNYISGAWPVQTIDRCITLSNNEIVELTREE